MADRFGGAGGPRQARVLVVDDDADMRELLQLYLGSRGCKVTTAADGREGLMAARAETPDVVITDWNMPVMDGFTLLQKLHRSMKLRDVPAVIFSAQSEDEAAKVIRGMANVGYVQKTDGLRRLCASVGELTSGGVCCAA